MSCCQGLALLPLAPRVHKQEQPAAPFHHAARFELALESSLGPTLQPGTRSHMLTTVPDIPRTLLLQRVADASPRLVLLEAPAGYGKSWTARKIAGHDACVVDGLGSDDAIDYHRRLLAALLGPAQDIAGAWEREALELARDIVAWRRLCVRAWNTLPGGDCVIFENVENSIDDPEIVTTLQALLERPNPNRRVLMCSRKPIPLRFGRFAFPHEMLRLSANDLRFSRTELSYLFELEPDSKNLHVIERLTRGWPMAAFLARRLQQRGLDATVDEMLDERDLFAFLADEVLSLLSPSSWDALYVIVLLDDATVEDVRAVSGDGDAGSIAKLLAEAPFVDSFGEELRAHPLMRDLVRARFPHGLNTAGKLAAARYERDGMPIRAAQIYIALGDSLAAARVIEGLVGTAWIASPSYELETILLQLDRSALLAYPAVWAFAMYGSVCALVSTRQWLHEGLEIWARHERAMSAAVAIGIGTNIINAYMNLGMLDEADAWLEKIRPLEPESVTVAIWSMALQAMRGRAVDPMRANREVLSRLLDTYPKALFLYEVSARVHRLRGERDAERAISARAIDIALTVNSAHAIQLTALDAAFGAWLAGEDTLYEEYLRLAEEHASPRSRERTRIFLECARGLGLRAQSGSEKLKSRAYAWLVAASLARASERFESLDRAHKAAEASSQPYARILVRVASFAAGAHRAKEALSEAASLAKSVDSPNLQDAIENLRSGGAGGMLSAFVARYREAASGGPQVRIASGELVVAGRSVPVTQRQLELVSLLAVHRRPLHRNEIVAAIWPDAEQETASSALRTSVSRLRATRGLETIVSTTTEGYALASDAAVDLVALRHVVGRCEATGSVSSEDWTFLDAELTRLLRRDRSRSSRWEWFAATEHELEALCWRIGSLLARSALAAARWQDAIEVGRRLDNYEPGNDIACEFIVRALVASGDDLAARHEIAHFEERMQGETSGSEGAAYLRTLLYKG
jgi:DNA-binding SARP family transcriptional activator